MRLLRRSPAHAPLPPPPCPSHLPQNYLVSLSNVTSIMVSHDSSFLDFVCTNIIHYENRKLRTYKGNLTDFVRQKPEARSYYELSASPISFKFPEPGYLEGVKTKDKAILKMLKVGGRQLGGWGRAVLKPRPKAASGSCVCATNLYDAAPCCALMPHCFLHARLPCRCNRSTSRTPAPPSPRSPTCPSTSRCPRAWRCWAPTALASPP